MSHSNGVAVEGADHHTVVQLIKRSGNTVRLSVLSVTDEERAKLEVESTPTPSSVEYYERRSIPLSIPSSEKKSDENGKEHVVRIFWYFYLSVDCVVCSGIQCSFGWQNGGPEKIQGV